MRFDVLSKDPQILLVHDFVSKDEAEYLMRRADGLMSRSMVVCDKPGGCEDARRTSESAHLPADAVTEAIRQRAMEFARVKACEQIQVVRYRPSQFFSSHYDQFDASTKQGAREIREGGQRAATLLVYLQAPQSGGATVFPKAGLSVAPVPRAAVFWRHHRKDGSNDLGTLHGGAPVLAGTKVAANIWLRGQPVRIVHHQINVQLSPLVTR